MAEELARTGALLIHYSTDYVYDGSKHGSVRRGRCHRAAERLRPDQARGRAGDRRQRMRVHHSAHHVGLRHSRQELPAHRAAPGAREGRAADGRRPVWRADLGARAGRGDQPSFSPGRWSASSADWRPGRAACFISRQAGETSWAGFAEAILDDYDRCCSWPADTGEFGGPLKAKRVVHITSDQYQDAGAQAAQFGALQRQGPAGVRDHDARLARAAAACHAGRDSLIIVHYSVAGQLISLAVVAVTRAFQTPAMQASSACARAVQRHLIGDL